MNTKQCHQSENKMLCIKGNFLTTTIQGYNLLHLLAIFRSLATCIYLMERSIIFVIWQEQGTKGPLDILLLVRWGRNKLPVLHRMFLPQKLVGLVRFAVIVPNLDKRNAELYRQVFKLNVIRYNHTIQSEIRSPNRFKNNKIVSIILTLYASTSTFFGSCSFCLFLHSFIKLWDFYDKSLIKAIKQLHISLNTRSLRLSLFCPHHTQSLFSSCLFWPFCCRTANNWVK